VKVCDKTCIFCFFPIINKYLCMAKRSLLSERPSCIYTIWRTFPHAHLNSSLRDQPSGRVKRIKTPGLQTVKFNTNPFCSFGNATSSV